MDILQEIGKREIYDAKNRKLEEKNFDLASQARCLLSKGYPVYGICNFGQKDLLVELTEEEKWTNETIFGETVEIHKENLKIIK